MRQFLSQEMVHLFLSVQIKSGVILFFAWTLTATLRRAPAATRHMIWSVAIIGVLITPLLSVFFPVQCALIPSTLASISAGAGGRANSNPPEQSPSQTENLDRLEGYERRSSSQNFSSEEASLQSPDPPSENVSTHFTWNAAFFILWLLGAGVTLTPVAVGLAGVWIITKRAKPITEPALLAIAHSAALRVGLKKSVTTFQSQAIATPMTWGTLRSIVLLPHTASIWTTEARVMALLHELSHVRRGDWLFQMLAHLACALYWMNPLMWLAVWRLRVERELACDDHVLKSGAQASAYARYLVEVATAFGGAAAPSAAIGMTGSDLAGRVDSILNPNVNRQIIDGRRAWIASALACALIAPLAVLHPWNVATAAAPQNTPSSAASNQRRPDAPASPSPVTPPAPPSPPKAPLPQDDEQFAVEQESEQSTEESLEVAPVPNDAPNDTQKAAPEKSDALSIERIIQMKAAGVTPEYIESIRRAGYDKLSPNQIVQLKIADVDEAFIKAVRGFGYGSPTIAELTQLKFSGAAADNFKIMQLVGRDGVTLSQVCQLYFVGVSADYIQSLRQLGYENLSASQLISLKSVGVDAEYVRQIRALGFEKLTPGQLLQLKAMGVTPDDIRKLQSVGLKNISPNQLIQLKATGLDQTLTKQGRQTKGDEQ